MFYALRRWWKQMQEVCTTGKYQVVKSRPSLDLDDIHAEALVSNRQFDTYRKLRTGKRSLYDGYKTPMPWNSDRIQAHADKGGIVLPTDEMRAKIRTPIALVGMGVGQLKTGRK